MVNGYFVILMARFLCELQNVNFCTKKTFLLLNNVIYTLLPVYKNVLYLWVLILFIDMALFIDYF